MRHADHGRLGDLAVGDHGAFYFRGPHAVAGDIQHVVHPPGDPVVAIFVAARTVAGEVHAAEGLEVGVDEAVMVAVDAAHLPRPGIENHQIAFGRALQQVAEVIHQARHHTEERPRGRARLECGGARQWADEDAAGLGLPPGVDDGATRFADRLVVPVPRFGIDRLTDRTQQAQARTIGAFDRGGAFGHHRADGGRRGVENVHLVLVDDLGDTRDVRVVGHPFVHQRGRAVGQRAVDDVAVPGDPADVGGTPEDLARPVVEYPLVGQRHIQQVARAGMQDTFWLAGGARRIKDEQGLFRPHFLRRADFAGDVHQFVVPDVAMLVPLDIAAGATHNDDLLHAAGSGVGQRLIDVFLERHLLAATQPFVGGDHNLRVAVDDAPRQGFRRETAEHHRMHRTDSCTGQHGHRHLGNHRHVDGDHVAAMHILAAQGVGELADFPVQLAVGDGPLLRRVVAFPDDGGRVTALLQVTIQAVGRHVEGAVCEPLDVHMVIVERSLLDRGEGPDPVEARCLFAPEPIGVDHRLLIQGLVAGLVGQGLGGHLGPYRI